MTEDLHQPTLRRVYDALRAEFAMVLSRRIASSSRLYDSGVLKGIDMAIDVLVRVNDGAPADPRPEAAQADQKEKADG